MKESGSMQRLICKPNNIKYKLSYILMTIMFAFLVFLSQTTGAYATPGDTKDGTLSYYYSTSSAYLAAPKNHELTKQTTDTAPSGAITVCIDGEMYYYTPNPELGDDTDFLQVLSAYGNSALVTTADSTKAVYSYAGTYYTYDPVKFIKDAYILTEVAAAGPNTVKRYEYDGGEYRFKYYEVSLNEANMNKNHLTFSSDSTGSTGSFKTTLNGAEKTVYYTYDDPSVSSGWTEEKDHLIEKNMTNADYDEISGGAARSVDEGDVISIDTTVYRNNSIKLNNNFTGTSQLYIYAFGGAIYNKGTINSLTADFVGNYICVSYTDNSQNPIISGFGGAIGNYGTIGVITGDFIENYVQALGNNESSGGAIYNSTLQGPIGTTGRIAEISGFNGSFINNYASSLRKAYGGAIYNSAGSGSAKYSNTAKIGYITGNFAGNYATGSHAYGGAIAQFGKGRSKDVIGNISGDFVGNYVKTTGNTEAYGGAIYNYTYSAGSNESIGDITGDFIGNYASDASSAFGGVIYNRADTASSAKVSVGNITGDFIDNYVSASSSAYGGAIYNMASSGKAIIGNVVSDFIGNYAKALTSSTTSGVSAYGGAIFNAGLGTTGDVSGDFANNYAHAEVTTTGKVDAYGGAIYNTSTIGNTDGGIINSSFNDNYARAVTTSEGEATARGGAIYTSTDLTLVAKDNYVSNISGNYVQTEKGSVVTQAPEAIYVDSNSATLTFKSETNGKFVVDDQINGADGYSIKFTGDNTGSADVNKTFQGQPKVIVDNSTLNYNTADNNAGDITTLTSVNVLNSGTFNYLLDIDITPGSEAFDKIVVSDASQGDITISNINLIKPAVKPETLDSFVAQVLQTEDSNLQLKLSSTLVNPIKIYTVAGEIKIKDAVGADTAWDDTFYEHTYENTEIYAKADLASVETTNDAIEISYFNDGGTETSKTKLGDTLALVNQKDLETRNFATDDATDTYTVDNAVTGLGETAAGNLNITGKVSGSDISTIDLNNKTGFELVNETNLNLDSVKLTGTDIPITVSNENASVGMNKSVVDGNISISAKTTVGVNDSTLNGNIVSTSADGYTLNIGGKSSFKGTVGNANATFNDAEGTLSMKENTFQNASLTTTAGKVQLQNGTLEEYNVGKLTSNADVLYDIDFNVTTKAADKIITGAESSGVVTINNINVLSGSFDNIDKDFKVQLLTAVDDNINLALTDTARGILGDKEYEMGTETYPFVDPVVAETPWTQDFYKQGEKTDTIYGQLGLVKSTSTSALDSIGVAESRRESQETSESQGDTLKVVNRADLAARSFKTDDSGATFKVKEDLGVTGAGTLEVAGDVTVTQVDPNDPNTFEMTRSTIDFDGHNGFELTNEDTTLNLKNVKLIGAQNVATSSRTSSNINFDNVEMIDNTYGVTTAGNVSIRGKSSIGSPIELTNENSSINIDATDTVTVKSELKGVQGSKLNVENGTLSLKENAQVTSLDTTLTNTTVELENESSLSGINMTLQGTNTVNMSNGSVSGLAFNTLLLNGTLNTNADVDMAKRKMDTITAETLDPNSTGIINVTKLNLLTPTSEKDIKIRFTDANLAGFVKYTGEGKIAYSPIYKYNTSYDKETGLFSFSRGSGGDPTSFNPSVLASQVSALTGIYGSQLQTFNLAFQHSDFYMDKSYSQRMAEKNENKYAFNTIEPAGMYSPLMTRNDKSGIWIKPYAVFERVPLHNGPKVSNINYGTMIGYDTSLQRISHGFDRAFTYYISYNGSTQSFNGVDIFQNGGLVGFTTSLYRGNFFNATTVSVGATIGDASSKHGSETFTSILAGVGNKLGYNFEFFDGRFILQPSLMMSYSFINTFDFKTSNNVKIKSSPYNILQFTPGLKFIGNTRSGWQPYLGVQFVCNIFINPEITANGTRLPSMYINPYVQYGFGVQKLFQDRFTLFCQAMVQNGGRNGVSVNAGMRWILGQ